jgi:hypothetical protein
MALSLISEKQSFKEKILTVAVLHRFIQLWVPPADETTIPELFFHTGARNMLITN